MSSRSEAGSGSLKQALEKFGPNETRKPADSSKARQTETQHGLQTPEATPDVDEARTRADEKRQQQEAKDARNSFSAVTKPSHPPSDDEDEDEATKGRNSSAVSLRPEQKKGHDTKTSTQNQPSQTTTCEEDKDLRTAKNGKRNKKSWTTEQEAAVNQAMSGKFGFQILGLNSRSRNEAGARKSWKKLAIKLHPDKNKHPQAEEAFKKAKAAAEDFGVEVEAGEEFLDHEGNPIETDEDEVSGTWTVSETDDDKMDLDSPEHSEDSDMEMEQAPSTRNDREPHKGAKRTHTDAKRTHTDADQTQPTALKWKWTTGHTAAGERIMAYRKQGNGHRCIVETKEGSPVFTFKSGVECGLLDLSRYLKMEGIWKLPAADKKRKWTNKYRDDFRKVDWVAFAPRKSHNPFSKSGGFRAPEVLCDITWSWGFESLSISELQRVISKGSADARINKLSRDNGHIPPEEADSIVRIQMSTKTMPPKQEDNLTVSADAASSKVNKRQQKRSGKKPTDSSLEELLTQMDRRMAKMEDAVTPLALIVAALVKETGLDVNKQ